MAVFAAVQNPQFIWVVRMPSHHRGMGDRFSNSEARNLGSITAHRHLLREWARSSSYGSTCTKTFAICGFTRQNQCSGRIWRGSWIELFADRSEERRSEEQP